MNYLFRCYAKFDLFIHKIIKAAKHLQADINWIHRILFFGFSVND